MSHRLPVGQQDLSPQDVEVVPGVGAVHNDPVTVVELTHRKVLCEWLHGPEGEELLLGPGGQGSPSSIIKDGSSFNSH